MSHSSAHIDPQSLLPHMSAYRAGDAQAGDHLAEVLRPVILLDVSRFLGDQHPDREDICQDTIVVALRYLCRDQEFNGNFVQFSVTIARNRCRDLLRKQSLRTETDIEPMSPFLADPGRSHLEDLGDRQMVGLLQKTLDRISQDCRRLLKALYLDDKSTQEVKEMIGLTTVQGVYHRRAICLDKMKKLLQSECQERSGGAKIISMNTKSSQGGPSFG